MFIYVSFSVVSFRHCIDIVKSVNTIDALVLGKHSVFELKKTCQKSFLLSASFIGHWKITMRGWTYLG